MSDREHPYSEYEDTHVWKAIEKGIADLVDNGDLTEATAREYIVGYLTKLVTERSLSDAHLRAAKKKIKQLRDSYAQVATVLGDLDEVTTSK